MARKVAGAVVVLLLLALLLSSSAGADASPRITCSVHQAKNPSCGTGHVMDGTCDKQCKSEGYLGWVCVSTCSCIICPSPDFEHRPETVELQKQAAGALAAGVGAV